MSRCALTDYFRFGQWEDAAFLQELVQKEAPLLRPAGMCYGGSVGYLIGFTLGVAFARVFLIRKPSAAGLVLDAEIMEQFIELCGAHAVVFGDKAYGNGCIALQDDIAVERFRRHFLGEFSESFALAALLLQSVYEIVCEFGAAEQLIQRVICCICSVLADAGKDFGCNPSFETLG